MATRKKPSAIGLAMLDLISNSLAAVIILFIIISSLRIPSIPPERIKGTFFVRYELIPDHHSEEAQSRIWVSPPSHPEIQKDRYFEEEVLGMNTDWGIFGQFSDCSGKANRSRESKQFITPCAMTSSPVDSTNVHYLVIRDPVKGTWKTGIFYREHHIMTSAKQPGKAKINAWFVGAEDPGIISPIPKLNLTGTTDSLGIQLETPDWATMN